MDIRTQSLITEAVTGSNEGRLHFGQVIELMVQAGVESYVADYRAKRLTYYFPDGESLSRAVDMPHTDIAQAFDADLVKTAIRGAQQGAVMYPEFKHLTMLAGCTGYTVWIAGRHVTYFGRSGETHIERFPN
ncbi:hypothetical protein NYP20_16015 [Pseudomonas sp. N3-W]|uniref:hypothetical protein n=1 Tax=Pseudomonas sp. N3-W TaxID=2975049 RepID=UPI00217E69A9|nr:hypothetical protein [Pseudomonas sp. N3-W]UWF46856.1 hypothetical protein NYP20_16015 [Pseudomonas sp. N3-W]